MSRYKAGLPFPQLKKIPPIFDETQVFTVQVMDGKDLRDVTSYDLPKIGFFNGDNRFHWNDKKSITNPEKLMQIGKSVFELVVKWKPDKGKDVDAIESLGTCFLIGDFTFMTSRQNVVNFPTKLWDRKILPSECTLSAMVRGHFGGSVYWFKVDLKFDGNFARAEKPEDDVCIFTITDKRDRRNFAAISSSLIKFKPIESSVLDGIVHELREGKESKYSVVVPSYHAFGKPRGEDDYSNLGYNKILPFDLYEKIVSFQGVNFSFGSITSIDGPLIYHDATSVAGNAGAPCMYLKMNFQGDQYEIEDLELLGVHSCSNQVDSINKTNLCVSINSKEFAKQYNFMKIIEREISDAGNDTLLPTSTFQVKLRRHFTKILVGGSIATMALPICTATGMVIGTIVLPGGGTLTGVVFGSICGGIVGTISSAYSFMSTIKFLQTQSRKK